RETVAGAPKAVGVYGAAPFFRIFVRSGTGTLLALNPLNPYIPFEHLTGRTAADDPATVFSGPDRVDVFVRTDSGETVQQTWTGDWLFGNWSGWSDLGGIATSRPAPASDIPGSIWVFVRGLDLAVWYRRFQAGAWGPWTSLGGIANSTPIP